jgi:hypothetical protein
VAVGVAVALCWHYLTKASTAYLLDLDVYREAAERGLGRWGSLRQVYTDVGLPWLYPPFAILFLTPISVLSDVSAQIVWTAITLASVIVFAVVCVWNFAADRFHTLPVYDELTIAFTLDDGTHGVGA